jgi:uncharacterized protein (DUF433 family)
MPIRVIDAKQALDDIRSGMDDNALMQKYRMRPRQLEQLFGTLESLHVLRRLNARDLVEDIRAGLNDTDLMAKYHLSKAALDNVFTEMIRNGLSVTPASLPQVRVKKRISAKEIVRDIRTGMTAPQIMKNYKLSTKGLHSLFRKLLEKRCLAEEEFAGVSPDEGISVILQKIRKAARHHPVLSVTVYEKRKPEVTGLLHDLSEQGIGVVGIAALPDEMKTLVLVPHESLPLDPFTIHVRCRWFKEGNANSLCSAGFEIAHAELSSLEALRELIEEVTLTFEE